MDGIYEIRFRGAVSWGVGILVFQNGKITGSDVGGAIYDGTFTSDDKKIHASIVLTVPPGGILVQGTVPLPFEQKIPFNVSINKSSIESGETVLLNLPPGPVNVIFKRLRSFNGTT